MKEYKTEWVEIQSELDELNKKLTGLYRKAPQIFSRILKKVAMGLLRILQENTPVRTGTLRSRWSVKKVNDFTYVISNPTEYLIYVELGIAGQGLSKDSKKRMKQLRYLFKKGILKSEKVGNEWVLTYHYEKVGHKSKGFVKRSIRSWINYVNIKLKGWVREELIKELKK